MYLIFNILLSFILLEKRFLTKYFKKYQAEHILKNKCTTYLIQCFDLLIVLQSLVLWLTQNLHSYRLHLCLQQHYWLVSVQDSQVCQPNDFRLWTTCTVIQCWHLRQISSTVMKNELSNSTHSTEVYCWQLWKKQKEICF